jgi:hypothetical protein
MPSRPHKDVAGDPPTMERTKRTHEESEPQCLAEVEALIATKEGQSALFDFIRYFALILDTTISGTDTWTSIGLSRSSHQLQAVFHEGTLLSYANGKTFTDFMEAFKSL